MPTPEQEPSKKVLLLFAAIILVIGTILFLGEFVFILSLWK